MSVSRNTAKTKVYVTSELREEKEREMVEAIKKALKLWMDVIVGWHHVLFDWIVKYDVWIKSSIAKVESGGIVKELFISRFEQACSQGKYKQNNKEYFHWCNKDTSVSFSSLHFFLFPWLFLTAYASTFHLRGRTTEVSAYVLISLLLLLLDCSF